LFQDANGTLREAREPAEMRRSWNLSAPKNSDTTLIRAIARSITCAFSAAPCWNLVQEALCIGTLD